MTIAPALKDYLDQQGVEYDVMHHPKEISAMKTAGAQHIPGKEFLKTVIVDVDGESVMCVLPATHNVNFEKLNKFLGASESKLAEEAKLGELFPEYELGAEPPFGQLHDLKVYLDKTVEEDVEIAFNAGTHTDVVKMKYDDYKRLVNPVIDDFGNHI